MSDTQLEKFDSSKLMDGVRDRIKASFASLIPDEHWNDLCKKEIDNFFYKQRDIWTNRDHKYVTDFELLCNQILTEIATQKVKDYIESLDSKIWRNGERICSEKLHELLVENSAEIFASTMGRMFQNVLSQMRYSN